MLRQIKKVEVEVDGKPRTKDEEENEVDDWFRAMLAQIEGC